MDHRIDRVAQILLLSLSLFLGVDAARMWSSDEVHDGPQIRQTAPKGTRRKRELRSGIESARRCG